MKGLAVVYRRTLEVSLHDQADEADQDPDEHRRGRNQRNRQDRTSSGKLIAPGMCPAA